MGRLFKQRITRYRLPDGKAVPKGTPGAVKCQERSKKWYGEYRDAAGDLKVEALCKDKSAAATMLNEKEIRADREASGRIDQFDRHGKRPLHEHVEAFGQSLESKSNTAGHVALTLARVRAVVEGCGFKRLADLSASRVGDWLANARRHGLPVAATATPQGTQRRKTPEKPGVSRRLVSPRPPLTQIPPP